MPEALLKSALRESTVEVLETMFFISDMEAAAVPEAATPAPQLAVHMTFAGSPSGWLALRADKATARSIAADFLGDDESGVTDQQAGEMICELANMICGSVLSRTGCDATYSLSSPRLTPPAERAEPQDACVHRMALTKGALTVFMKSEIARVAAS
jgi:CheY-specific phosphatase CheX